MSFKKLLFVAGISCSLMFAKQINIVFISNGLDADPFWNVVKNGLQDAAKEVGAKADYRNSPTGDRTEMARILQATVSRKPDAIILSIPDKDALSRDVKRALDAGIPVINVNSGYEYGKELGIKNYIGSSEYQAGLAAGKNAKQAGIKTFVCVNQEITNTVLEQRCKGFADGLGVTNNMLDVGIDPSEISKKVAPVIDRYDAVLTLGPNSAAAVIDLVKKRRIKKYFVTFDLSKDIIKAIKDDIIVTAVDQQPYLQGYLPVILLDKYIKYGVMPHGDIFTGPAFVTKSNVELVEKNAGSYR